MYALFEAPARPQSTSWYRPHTIPRSSIDRTFPPSDSNHPFPPTLPPQNQTHNNMTHRTPAPRSMSWHVGSKRVGAAASMTPPPCPKSSSSRRRPTRRRRTRWVGGEGFSCLGVCVVGVCGYGDVCVCDQVDSIYFFNVLILHISC
jgi:hypothetical protein